MALSQNKTVFLQTPRTATAILTTASTDLDDSPTTSVHLFTAGDNGSRLIGLTAMPRATVTATRIDLWISKDSGTTQRLIGDFLMAAHTVANTTAIPVSDSGLNQFNGIELEAGDRVYVSASVSLAAGIVVFAKFIDYGGSVAYPSRFVSNAGSDSNDGLTEATAWQTLAKVNATSLSAGATVAFRGGDVFSGYLDVSNRAGTNGAPITFTSYGTGRATINSANSIAIYGDGAIGDITIDGINLVGSGKATNTQHGIFIWNGTAGGVKRPRISVKNMEISGFGLNGMTFGADPGDASASGFSDPVIQNITVHDCGRTGIQVYGETFSAHTNVNISGCIVYNCDWSAIVASHIDGGLIESCIAHDNGATYTGGSVAIMIYDDNAVTIRTCEAYNQQTPNAGGGNGFNIDQRCTDCVIEYSYAHNNTGAGIECYGSASGTWANNTIRYNVCENNCSNNDFMGAFNYATAGGAMTGLRCYNNTFYTAVNDRSVIRIANNNLQGDFVNNIFVAGTGVYLVRAQTDVLGSLTPSSGLLFRGNDYFQQAGTFAIIWGGTTYASMAAWRAAYVSQETISGGDASYGIDPQLYAVGSGGTINATNSALTAYKLITGSPMIGVGRDVSTLLAISAPTRDFYGDGVPHATGTGFNIGAYGSQSGVTAPASGYGPNFNDAENSIWLGVL